MALLDQECINKPLRREEQYISVSISGYVGVLLCEHIELKSMANVFANQLKAENSKNLKQRQLWKVSAFKPLNSYKKEG